MYLIALGVTQGPRKRALLLHRGGLDLQDIFDNLDGGDTFEEAVAELDAKFRKKRNDSFERNKFRQMCPRDKESTSQFVTRLE